MNCYRLLLAVAFLTAFLLPASVQAQAPDVTVNDVASDLYCPLCAGLTVDVCELEVCAEMRQIIDEKLAAGEEPEAIKAYFIEQYGQSVVGMPSTEGFHLAAWVTPFLALLAALAVLALWLRSRQTAAALPTTRVERMSERGAEYEAQLDRELRRMEE